MRRGVVERRTTYYGLDSFASVSKGLFNEDYCFLFGWRVYDVEFSFVPVRMFAVYQIPPLDTKPGWNTSLDGTPLAGCAC
jgi:hypothetical protein